MKYSLSLGRPFGIKISIHWTFLLLILWIVAINVRQGASTPEVIMSILFILTLFLCVTLHELGHALTARRYNVETKGITLLPIGGMAHIQEMPEKPKEEIMVTLGGLVVNIIIAMILWAVISLVPAYSFNVDLERVNSQNFWVLLMYVNLFIVIFNIIPAFPMDGGRLLRAALSYKFSRLEATKYAMMSGQVFGAIFAIAGLFINPFLVIIGIFVFIGARVEYSQVKFRTILSDYKVKDIILKDYTSFSADDPLQKAVDKLLNSREVGFLVVKEEDVVGILSKDNIISGLSDYGKEGKVQQVMTKEFDRVEGSDSLSKVMMDMQKNKYDILPVFDNGNIIGVLDQENIQEFIMVHSALHEKESD